MKEEEKRKQQKMNEKERIMGRDKESNNSKLNERKDSKNENEKERKKERKKDRKKEIGSELKVKLASLIKKVKLKMNEKGKKEKKERTKDIGRGKEVYYCGTKETFWTVPLPCRGNKLTNTKTLLNSSKVYWLRTCRLPPGERNGVWKHEISTSTRQL